MFLWSLRIFHALKILIAHASIPPYPAIAGTGTGLTAGPSGPATCHFSTIYSGGFFFESNPYNNVRLEVQNPAQHLQGDYMHTVSCLYM